MQTNLSAQEFAGKLLGIYTGAVLTNLIDIGYQTGLFEAASRDRQPAASSLRGRSSVSLAYGGAGLGAVYGIAKAKAMLAEAGFRRVEVLDSPRPQNCIYVCRK
jgi:hypothetical protein